MEDYQMCTRCIMDTTVPGIRFDGDGECNFCSLHDKMDQEFPVSGELVQKHLNKIIKAGRGRKYDCVLGISGGRDSMHTLYMAKKVWGLSPIAVHFNDGFGNPAAGENMANGCKILGVELRTITSDWRESKDLKIAFLKGSTSDMEEATDLGIATALYGVAAKERVKYILIGQSFRTEGIAPLSWNYLDGRYLKSVHKEHGQVPLRPWKPDDPGFNLGLREMFYYAVLRGIKTVPILYYTDYIRQDVDEVLEEKLKWQNPGAHYYDDLYQSIMTYVLRTKFNINRRLFNYSALVRSGQMEREAALGKSKEVYSIEDPKVITLCIKRLGLTEKEFRSYLDQPPKSFRDYKNSYTLIRALRPLIWILAKLNFIPASAYDKYFNCGE